MYILRRGRRKNPLQQEKIMISLLLTAVMIAALCGMVICNRKHRKGAHYQLIALGLLVVVIASGGMFMCCIDAFGMLGLSESGKNTPQDIHRQTRACGFVLGNYIHSNTVAGSKILLISSEKHSLLNTTIISRLAEFGMTNVVQEHLQLKSVHDEDNLVNPTEDRMAESLSIDEAVARHPDAKFVVISGLSPSGEALRRLKTYKIPESRRPRLIIVGITRLNDWVYNQLENNYFDALIATDLTKNIPNTESSDNLLEVFNNRFVLITRQNLVRNQRFFHH